jgi:RHS repeat-associated protein
VSEQYQGQSEEPQIGASQFDANSLGDINSSVNLYRGEVNLPLPMVRLDGPNGLEVDLSAFYSSNVQQLVSTWNLDAPTGVLGVGWSWSESKIVVEPNGCAPGYDDRYYLVSGGTVPLYRIGTAAGDATAIAFAALSLPFWRIVYFPNSRDRTQERWEISKEDGKTYTYGRVPGTSAEASGIDWRVCWDNWIGPTANAGGTQFPFAWKLVEIRDDWGNKIGFFYENDDQPIGRGLAKSTRSSQLVRILDARGRTISFKYRDKEPDEIQLPATTPPGRAPVHQFDYPRVYLDSIEVDNPDGQPLFHTHFDYQLTNVSGRSAATYIKRYVTGVRQVFANGAAPPGFIFRYNEDASDDNCGALRQIVYPKGSAVDYEYTPVSVSNATTRTTVTAPGRDYEPSVWYGDSYVVVAWYNRLTNRARFAVYSWRGDWRSWQTQNEIGNFRLDDLNILTAAGFFVVYFKDSALQRYRVLIYRTNPYRSGEWLDAVEVQLDHNYDDVSVVAGTDWVAVRAPAAREVVFEQWDDRSRGWRETRLNSAACTKAALAARGNCCLAAYYDESRSDLTFQLYYSDADRVWRAGDVKHRQATIDWTITSPGSFWAVGPGYAAATYVTGVSDGGVGYEMAILQWRQNFTFSLFQTYPGRQPERLANPIAVSTADATQIGNGQRCFRFDGRQWQQQNLLYPQDGTEYSYARGLDLVVAGARSGGAIRYSSLKYDPQAMAWQQGEVFGQTAAPAGAGAPSISNAYCLIGYDIFYRGADSVWRKTGALPNDVDLLTVQNRAPSYIAYQTRGANQTCLLFLKDGTIWAGPERLPNGEMCFVAQAHAGQMLCGPNAFMSYRTDRFSDARELYLYRVLDQTATAVRAHPVVGCLTVDGGYGATQTEYRYDPDTATCDPSGMIAQFTRVTSLRGEGRTETTFFNGLAPEGKGVVYPESDAYTNVAEFFSMVGGQVWQTRSFHADGRLVAATKNWLYAFDRDQSGNRLFGAYVRQRRKVEAAGAYLFDLASEVERDLDAGTLSSGIVGAFAAKGITLAERTAITDREAGVRWTIAEPEPGRTFYVNADDNRLAVHGTIDRVVENEYNTKGQLRRSVTHNVDAAGTPQQLVRQLRYAWEVYPEMARANRCNDIVETRQLNGTTNAVGQLQIDTYRKWQANDGRVSWAKHRQYRWTGEPGTDVFDFAAWSENAEPASGWIKLSQTTAMAPNGQPLESVDVDGRSLSILYDQFDRLRVAEFADASLSRGEAAYLGFESYEKSVCCAPYPAGHSLSDFIWEGEAHTGRRCLRLPGTPGVRQGIEIALSPARGAQRFVFSFWARRDAAAAAGDAGWALNIVGTAAGADTNKTDVLAIAPSDTQWQFFHFVLDPAQYGLESFKELTLASFNEWAGSALLVDDIFFAPFLGGAKSVVADPHSWNTTADVTILGETRRYAWDAYYRHAVQTDVAGVPTSLVAEYNWRSTGQNAFDPVEPNAVLGVTGGGGTFDDFGQGDAWRQHWQGGEAWQLAADGTLTWHGQGEGSLVWAPALPAEGGLAVRAMLANFDEKCQPFGLRLGTGVELRLSGGQWQLFGPGSVQPIKAVAQTTAEVQDLLLLGVDGGLMFWVDGRLVLSHVFAAPVNGVPQVFVNGPGGVSALAVLYGAGARVQFADNAGRVVQEQALDGAAILVDASLHDASGRHAVQTSATRCAGSLFGYRPNFVASFDWASGVMTGEVVDANPEAAGSPFSRKLFEAAPTGRVREVGAPGMVSGGPAPRTTRLEYAAHVHNGILDDLPAGEHLSFQKIDEDGHAHIEIVDRVGNSIATITGDPSAPSARSVTRRYYDGLGRPVRIELPNFAREDIPDRERFVTTVEYDQLGRVTSRRTADQAAPELFAYDPAGRKRFSQDAAGNAAGYVRYWSYDAQGRLLEEGSCNSQWDAALFRQHAADRDWLPGPGTWRRRFVYDGDGKDPNAIGRLVSVTTSNSGRKPAADIVETFVYDRAGRTTAKTVTLAATGTTRTTTYRYDAVGNMVEIGYDGAPAGFRVAYAYDGLGRVRSIAGYDGPDGPAIPIARYRYDAAGKVSEELLNQGSDAQIETRFLYTARGWPTSISSPYFRESLSYFSGGYGGDGYFTGKVASTRFQLPTLPSAVGITRDSGYRYRYDPEGRLVVAESIVDPKASIGVKAPIAYDGNGNRLAIEIDGRTVPYSYAAGSNRLIAAGGDPGKPDFGYDANGDVVRAASRGVAAIDYDPVSRLALSIAMEQGEALRLQYDGSDLRVLRARAGTVRVLYLGQHGQPLVETITAPGGKVETRQLIHGPRGLIAIRRNGRICNLLSSHEASVRAVVADGKIVAGCHYDPFGSIQGLAYADPASGWTTDLRFGGQALDDATGLYLFPARLYDPAIGRFYAVDPERQFVSPYLYANNDPVLFIDPTGRFSWAAFGAIFVGAVLVVAGAILTVATMGAATPALAAAIGTSSSVAAAILGTASGAVIGAGISSAVYGATHNDDRKFNWGEWGAMVGLGAAFGAVTGGVGAISGGSSAVVGVLVDTVLGGTQGLVTNGVSNVFNGQSFFDNVGMAVGLGAGLGFATGFIGRWSAFKTGRAFGDPAAPRSQIAPGYSRGGFHATIGVDDGAGALNHFELTKAGPGNSLFGQAASVSQRGWAPHASFALDLPTAQVTNARNYAQGLLGPVAQPYNVLTNSCVTYAKDTLRAAGLEPPLWTVSGAALYGWARLIAR